MVDEDEDASEVVVTGDPVEDVPLPGTELVVVLTTGLVKVTVTTSVVVSLPLRGAEEEVPVEDVSVTVIPVVMVMVVLRLVVPEEGPVGPAVEEGVIVPLLVG